jgi:hypothetical protein
VRKICRRVDIFLEIYDGCDNEKMPMNMGCFRLRKIGRLEMCEQNFLAR